MNNLRNRILLLSLLLFKVYSTLSTNLYWVGGTGAWNQPKHWSSVSGGVSGTIIPSMNDNVFFDENSFFADKQTVMVTTDAACNSIDWTGIDQKAVFSCSISRTLTVYGSYKLSPLLISGFKGKTIFSSSAFNNTISTAGRMIVGDWVFSGNGSWVLQDDLLTGNQISLNLLQGELITNGKKVNCGYFTGNSVLFRSLTLSNSEITVKNSWDCSISTNFTLDPGTSTIIFSDSITHDNFKDGNLRYANVSTVSALGSNSVTCVFAGIFTITLTADSVTCNGLNDGSVCAVVTGGSGTFLYDWNFVATPLGDGTPCISLLGSSTNTVKVTDVVSGLVRFCSISVGEPPVLNDYEVSHTEPSCFGLCNGFIDVDETGGTPPYTYVWSGGLGTNDTALNVCAGTYTATVTDSRGCSDASAVVFVDQPALLVAPGTATMVSCNSFCDGTAAVIPSGGTSPYTYDWTPGSPIGDLTPAISALCIGSYSCTVTDINGCIATFDTIITQPPVLTLAMSHVNATCGGVCDGSATATVSGGTTPYIFTWSNGAVTSTATTINTISGLCAGTYIVVITDANGCSKTDSVVVAEPPVLIATAIGTSVSCFGICDGTASVIVVGGNGGNTFNWSPGTPVGDGTATITSLCPNTYSVTVIDNNGCIDTGVVVISEPALLLSNPISTNVLCFGACNGTATSIPSGGTLPYLFDWTPGAPIGDGTPSITGLCPNTYSVTVTDGNGCTNSQSVTITQPLALNAGLSFTNVTCNGACDGTATSTPSGGTAGYSFLWNTGAVTSSISGLCPGSYTVTVTDANFCTTSATVVISQPNVLSVSVAATTLACNGDCNAVAVATILGGAGPFTIDWSPASPIGDGTTTISSLCAGTYNVTVTDNNGCPANASNTILQPTILTLTTSSSDASCFGICNGTAATVVGGGTPGYSFSWSPGGQITSSLTLQCDGTYTVTATDLNGCSISDIVTILEPAQLLANPSVLSNISCVGVIPCDGSAISNPSGGTGPYTFDWTPGTPTGDFTSTISGLCAGTYNVNVLDSNLCSSTMPIVISQPLVLSAPISGSTSSCNVCNGTATVTPVGGTPGYSFLWMPTGQTTATATGLCPNVTYTVTVTDANGCVASNTITILQTILISITTSNTTLSCFGACDGIATANASGGTIPYSYVWTGPSGIVSLLQTATGLCAGTYTVNVSDAAGCLNADTVTFTNPPQLLVSALGTNLDCAGVCSGTATATTTGGIGVYSFLWMPGGQTTATATALCAGTYTITVTDGNACTSSSTVIITEPTPVDDVETITNANCTFADGSISVFPTGGLPGYAFNWGPGTPTGDGTATITNLLAGAYTLAITDASGCVFNFNYLLNNISGPSVSMVHTNVSCNNVCDATATATATLGAGGYVYDWTPGIPTGDGTSTITALCGGITYTVQVTDAAGCITLDTTEILNPALISPNPTVINESCGGTCDGSIALAPSGGSAGYTYLWSNGATTSSITGLCAGVYSFTVTDANGCDSSSSITITSAPALIVTLSSTNVLCNSACNGTATATVIGGSGAGTYSYVWSHGGVFVLPNVVGLCPGSYTVNVTDGNSCSAADTIVITEPLALTTSTSQTNSSCFGICDGEAVVTASGGSVPYFYLWAPGAIANDTASGLCAGSYNATVTDFNGCVSNTTAVLITEPASILPNAVATNPLCNSICNGTATANPTGGSGIYTYSWNTIPVQTTQTAIGLCSGSYIVTVDDGNCSATQNIALVDPPLLNANPSFTSPTCSDDCDGSVTANPLGGTGTFSYSWSPGGFTSQTVNSLCPNVYSVIVADANGCKDTVDVTLVNTFPIDIIVGSAPANCGACDGSISVTPITGTAPYTYIWTIGGVAPPLPFAGNGTSTVSNVCAGLYDVLVTDANGCDSLFTIPMNNSSGASGETVNSTITTCNGVCDGAGSVTPIGGTAPYSFLWNDGPATSIDTAFNLCAGNYFVRVTDATGCIHFSPVTISEPSPILSNEIITSASCSSICTGAINVSPSGGNGGYTYLWSPGLIAGQGTSSVSALCSGTYTLTITDVNLCTQVDSFSVGQSSPLSAVIGTTNISCSNVCSGLAYVTISSGTPPYSIQWNDAFGQTNDTASALCEGNYSVEITDALGCTITLNTTITATSAVVANASITGASCGLCDGSVILAPSGGTAGYTYLWSNGQTTSSASALCSGLYTVEITDANGCVTNVSIPVNNTSGPTSATISATAISCSGSCNGAVTAVSPIGGTAPYSYLWIASGQTTSSLTNLCAGIYFVQITDTNGCSLIDSVIITEPSAISANQIITAASCGVCDGSINIAPSGGTAPYAILWNTGSTSLSLINLCAGIYSVDITDATGCVQNVTIPLNSQNGPTLVASSTSVTCNGSCNASGSVAATGFSPFVYLWDDAALQTTAVTTSTLCAGLYFVQVTDAAGCVSVAFTNVTEPDTIGFSVANAINPLCNGNANGSITVIPSGGTLSYSYNWTPAPALGQTTATASGLNANTYIVTVTDANACVSTQTTTLTSPVALTISSTFVPSSCNTIPDGSIDVTVVGGTLPYLYQWTGASSATSEDLIAVLSGTYTITVTDTNSCSIADTVLLLSNQTVNAVAGNDTTYCASGSITLDGSTSINGISFQWFDMTNTLLGSSATLALNPPAGTNSFYLIVDNGTGCSDSDTVNVTANPLPLVNAGTDVTIVIGASTTLGGTPTTNVVGGIINWTPVPGALNNPAVSNPIAAPIATTSYTVTVTSLEGCIASDSVVVTILPGIVFPDGISPNADGANDEWIIDGIDLFPECLVEVYNRWGELLFQSIGYKENWDGSYKGKPLPVGTYYYIIDLKDPLFPDAYTGPITIMR